MRQKTILQAGAAVGGKCVRIGVVGAGVAGPLFAAIVNNKYNSWMQQTTSSDTVKVEIDLFERQSVDRDQGCGYDLDNLSREALKAAGVFDRYSDMARADSNEMNMYCSGRKDPIVVLTQPRMFYRWWGPKLETNRDAMRSILLESLNQVKDSPPSERHVITNSYFMTDIEGIRESLSGVKNAKNSAKACLLLSNGSAVLDGKEYDLVIDSSGIGSPLRGERIADERDSRERNQFYTGVTMVHGVVKDPESTVARSIVDRMGEGTVIMYGPKGRAVTLQRYGVRKEDHRSAFFYSALMDNDFELGRDHLGFTKDNFYQPENSEDIEKIKKWIINDMGPGWDPEFHGLVRALDVASIRPIYQHPAKPHFRDISLPLVAIGDALHTVPPWTGKGGNLAMADAKDLAEFVLDSLKKYSTSDNSGGIVFHRKDLNKLEQDIMSRLPDVINGANHTKEFFKYILTELQEVQDPSQVTPKRIFKNKAWLAATVAAAGRLLHFVNWIDRLAFGLIDRKKIGFRGLDLIAMPTVVLLDTSLSLCRPICNSDAGFRRQDVLQLGTLHFLKLLETKCPFELCALFTFSSSCHIVSPFTRDYAKLKSFLYDVSLEDKTCLDVGLSTVANYLNNYSDVDGEVHVVVVTDGCSSGIKDSKSVSTFKAPTKIHFILLHELNEQTEFDSYAAICQRTGGSLRRVLLPEHANKVKREFESLFDTHFMKFCSFLSFGYLLCRIHLYPAPSNTFAKSLEGRYSSSGSNRPNIFPEVVSVYGFIPLKAYNSAPSLSKHMVIPKTSNQESDEQMFMLLGIKVLLESMEKKGVCGVVKFGENWFGFLIPVRNGKYLDFELSVMEPGQEIPWLYCIETLSGEHAQEPESLHNVLPKSYISQKGLYTIPWSKKSVLQLSLQKFFRHAKSVMEKKELFLNELNNLRSVSRIYGIPDLLPNIASDLSADIERFENQKEAQSAIKKTIDILNEPSNGFAISAKEIFG
eukprot:Nk52_evm53s252 gene=Nk52_evmTU53s252